MLGCTQPTLAARLVDVSIVNRSTGERLTPYQYGGRLYVAGMPGDRYAVELKGKQNERVLTVLSVDGINVLTGQTAATLQSGYVIDGGQSYGISGWRKSMDDVAQFVFTALPDSYAARTGRPGNVGVIGVAVYREKVVPAQPIVLAPFSAPSSLAKKSENDTRNSAHDSDNGLAAAGVLAERRADLPESRAGLRAEVELKSMKLGTGHGEREYSPTSDGAGNGPALSGRMRRNAPTRAFPATAPTTCPGMSFSRWTWRSGWGRCKAYSRIERYCAVMRCVAPGAS